MPKNHIWTPEEDAELLKLINDGYTPKKIIELSNWNKFEKGSIASRINKLKREKKNQIPINNGNFYQITFTIIVKDLMQKLTGNSDESSGFIISENIPKSLSSLIPSTLNVSQVSLIPKKTTMISENNKLDEISPNESQGKYLINIIYLNRINISLVY